MEYNIRENKGVKKPGYICLPFFFFFFFFCLLVALWKKPDVSKLLDDWQITRPPKLWIWLGMKNLAQCLNLRVFSCISGKKSLWRNG